MKKFPWKKIFNIAVYLLSACIILYFCLSPKGLVALVHSAEKINLAWLGAAFLCHLGNLFIDSVLMYKFICHTSRKISFKHAVNVAMTGQFFNSVTPAASGGQPMQLFVMHQYGFSAGEGMSALLQKFIVWQFTTTGYSVVVLLFKFRFFIETLSPGLRFVAALGFLMQIGLLCALLMISISEKTTYKLVSGICKLGGKIKVVKNPERTIEKVENQLKSFHDGNKKLNSNKKFLAEVYLISIIHVTVIYMVPYCIYKSFGLQNTGLFDIICAQTFVNVVSSLMPSPGASGAAELSFVGFFGNVFSAETLQSATLLWRTITYYSTIIIASPFARLAKSKTKGEKED